ncbi:MAG TPA: 2-oxo acid dehydrogenase subunit E2 [Streptosporangiaceae bacterium]
MSVSVSMPQLGESVTEGTVTRWLKREGDHVSADEPLLEVSTDKVDTEIPSPVSGVLRGITVAEDETVAVGAELAVIDEDGAAPSAPPGGAETSAEPPTGEQQAVPAGYAAPAQPEPLQPEPVQPEPVEAAYQPPSYEQPAYQPPSYEQPAYEQPAYQPPSYEQPAYEQPAYQPPSYEQPGAYQPPAYEQPAAPREAEQAPTPAYQPPSYQPPSYEPPQQYAEPEPAVGYAAPPAAPAAPQPGVETGESPYVTPLVRKLAAEHGIDLGSITGTGVGGRIRKQDVLDAARQRPGIEFPAAAGPAAGAPAAAVPAAAVPAAAIPAAAIPAAAAPAAASLAAQPAVAAPSAPAPSAAPAAPAPAAAPGQPAATQAAPRTILPPSTRRGTTERLSRARQVIAQRMVESLQTSAQLTTVIEADVTAIARLRERSRAGFEAREGVKLSFLPFFALATVEALKAHPKLNAVIDTANGTVTYHDAEHLGVAVDTDRGLMVPVIRNAGDLNIGGLARKIADLAQRTRAGQVNPDDLSGGTFTLTNTGSRGALFDTPIINQPQVGILGTGTVNKRAVVVEDPHLGEVITVRSVVYLALTYDHRLVDGADAARFLVTIKNRLEEGAFEAELGL